MELKKINVAKVLPVVVTALGVVGTLLSNKVEANNRKELKAELKDELLKELSKK